MWVFFAIVNYLRLLLNFYGRRSGVLKIIILIFLVLFIGSFLFVSCRVFIHYRTSSLDLEQITLDDPFLKMKVRNLPSVVSDFSGLGRFLEDQESRALIEDI